MNNQTDLLRAITRRYFFKENGLGIGSIALSLLLNNRLFGQPGEHSVGAVSPLAPKPPHFAPKAKSIIFLFMAGGPSQVDLLDYKPKLNELNGQKVPESFIKGERFAFIKGVPNLLGSPHTFQQYGRSGAYVSNLLPHLTSIVDEVAIVKSVYTDQFNHAPAQIFMNTGAQNPGRPSLGAWLTYGIGSENSDLPGFVVLISGENNPEGGKSCWSSGFLPTTYQGVEFRSKGDPVLFLSNPDGINGKSRRELLEALQNINQMHFEEVGDSEIITRIASYEMSYRMQSSVPELMEIDKEPRSIQEMYGIEPGKVSFANNCLLARRLVERGVRFVQLYHRGWDHHGGGTTDDLLNRLPQLCRETDQAATALVKDLKQQGLLDTTLVIWGGEFGRTPMNEGRSGIKFLGRDHHPRAFCMWLTGGGIKPGIILGQTDELGYSPVDEPVHVHDLHATILHLMGLDHTKLTYKFQGREFRLTDVHGNLVNKLLA
jgi:hypothetical protein